MTKTSAQNTRYNGWMNRATWNVALWISNDEGLYRSARCFAENKSPFDAFRDDLREMGIIETPDGVSYNDSGLDIDALDEMMREL